VHDERLNYNGRKAAQEKEKNPMDKTVEQQIKHYLSDIEKIGRNKKISPMTVPESHAAAVKLATRLPADIDTELGAIFFSALFRKGGLFRELKFVSEKHYPLLLAGLKHRILDAGGKQLGFLDEMELRFALGISDLKKAAKTKSELTPRADFLAAVALINECNQYSNFPNMLKKREKLVNAFTPALLDHAEIALLSTQYLGSDTSQRYFFVPAEFRLYWLMMIGILDRDEKCFEKILKTLDQKKLIKNKTEFAEMLGRIR